MFIHNLDITSEKLKGTSSTVKKSSIEPINHEH